MTSRRTGALLMLLASAPITLTAALTFYAWTYQTLHKEMTRR